MYLFINFFCEIPLFLMVILNWFFFIELQYDEQRITMMYNSTNNDLLQYIYNTFSRNKGHIFFQTDKLIISINPKLSPDMFFRCKSPLH